MKKAEDCMTFGDRLAYARKKKGLTQKQLGELIGVGKTLICFLETGRKKKDPNTPMIRKMVKVLEVSEDWLMGNSDDFRMENLPENLKNIKLTKEQQQLIINNQQVIGTVYRDYVRDTFNSNYDDYYGEAAVVLCEAAKSFTRQYDEKRGFYMYALTYLKYAIWKTQRKEYRYSSKITSLESHEDDFGDDHDFGSVIPDPNDDFEMLEYKILVESVCQKVGKVLLPKEKELFQLWLYGFQCDEIARKLGISLRTVSSRKAEIREKCRASLNPDEMFA